MFTGIITHLGRVHELMPSEQGLRLDVKVEFNALDLDLGASVAHNGCCLTVVERSAHHIITEVSPETLSKTTLGTWQVGDLINIERALKFGDELGGHLVSGHVDGQCYLLSILNDGMAHRLRLKVPKPLHRFIAPKGSVCLDGISLTINEVDGDEFGVAIIPHTWEHTHLKTLKPGQALNLEVDLLARYAARWHETQTA